MVNYFKFINKNKIEAAPRPLRVGDEDIFTTDETIYNEQGYYRLEREPYPTDEKFYIPYYELSENVIYQKWEESPEPPYPPEVNNE